VGPPRILNGQAAGPADAEGKSGKIQSAIGGLKDAPKK
jgi:hypothetical protein